MTSNELTN